jgi:hypothetical protein
VNRPRPWLLTAGWLAVLVAVVAAADVKVTPLVTPDGKVVASVNVASAFNQDTRDVLKSGLQLTFAFTVELRRAGFFADRTLGAAAAVAKVKLDTLRGDYTVSKELDGHVTFANHTDQEDQMRAWLTQFDRVPIEVRDPLEQNGEYYVQVKLNISPRQRFPLWPWGRNDGSGRADFTFIR